MPYRKAIRKKLKKAGVNPSIKQLAATLLEYQEEKEFLKARLASFTDFNPRPITEMDMKGRIFYTNPSCNSAFPDLKKKGELHPYLADIKKILQKIKKERKGIVREVKIGKRWYRQNIYYIPSFNIVRIFGLDITENKHLEKELENTEKRYQMLFEKLNYGYVLQDIIFDEHAKPIDYRFIDANPAFSKISRLKRESLVGKTANEISTRPANPQSLAMRKAYDRVAVTGKPMRFESYNEALKKHFELYAYRPNPKQMALIFSDITHRKKTDEEKNNFISIMSHELRNPLTPILANAQFIDSIVKKERIENPKVKESIAIIEKQAKMMADLLNDILDVSRLSRNKITLKKTRLNLQEAVKNSIKNSMPFINTKNQKLSVFLEKTPLYINADALRIEQIIINVVNNASKYTPPKGTIEVHCNSKNGWARITVKDTGIGMSTEKIRRIFDLFSEESQPFMGIGGLGIGLNIVKNLVTMHKGEISVTSRGKNRGSEFIIRLPMHSNGEKQITHGKLPEIKPGEKKHHSKILVVDDNEDIRSTISTMLRHEGHQIKTAHNGGTAVKISKTFTPDIALIDIGLPDMNGYQVARLLKEQYKNYGRKIKLIAFTGYGQAKDQLLSKEAGFDHHITKPIDFLQLNRFLS